MMNPYNKLPSHSLLKILKRMNDRENNVHIAVTREEGTCLTPLFNSIEDTMNSIQDTISTLDMLLEACKPGSIDSFINNVHKRRESPFNYTPLLYLIDKYFELDRNGKEYEMEFMKLFDKVLERANPDMRTESQHVRGSRTPLLHYIIGVSASDKEKFHLPLLKLLKKKVDKNVNLEGFPLVLRADRPPTATEREALVDQASSAWTPLQSALKRIVHERHPAILKIPSLLMQEPRPCVTTLDGFLLMKIVMEKDDDTISPLLKTVLKDRTWNLPEYQSFDQRLNENMILSFIEANKERLSPNRYQELRSYFQAEAA